jgi:hypothetical protein
MADVKITTTTPDTKTLGRRLSNAERAVLKKWARRFREGFQNPWVGWKYEGRPVDAPRLVSYDAWTERIDSTMNGPRITILNQARGWRSGKPYVAFVKRSKNAQNEVERLTDHVNRQLLPTFVDELTREIMNALTKPGPSRPIRDGDTGTETLELEI